MVPRSAVAFTRRPATSRSPTARYPPVPSLKALATRSAAASTSEAAPLPSRNVPSNTTLPSAGWAGRGLAAPSTSPAAPCASATARPSPSTSPPPATTTSSAPTRSVNAILNPKGTGEPGRQVLGHRSPQRRISYVQEPTPSQTGGPEPAPCFALSPPPRSTRRPLRPFGRRPGHQFRQRRRRDHAHRLAGPRLRRDRLSQRRDRQRQQDRGRGI